VYKNSVERILLQCLGINEAYIAMAKVYNGIYGSQTMGEKMG